MPPKPWRRGDERLTTPRHGVGRDFLDLVLAEVLAWPPRGVNPAYHLQMPILPGPPVGTGLRDGVDAQGSGTSERPGRPRRNFMVPARKAYHISGYKQAIYVLIGRQGCQIEFFSIRRILCYHLRLRLVFDAA